MVIIEIFHHSMFLKVKNEYPPCHSERSERICVKTIEMLTDSFAALRMTSVILTKIIKNRYFISVLLLKY